MRYVLFILSLASLLLSAKLYAQSGEIIIENDLQQEVSRESGGMQEVIEVPAQQQQPAPSRQILILNRSNSTANSTSAQVQQQPVTNVEATPLTDSRASQLRRAREDAEVATEQKIVEKLEQSRLEDEKERAQRLFGNKLENQNVQQEIIAPTVQVIQQEPAPQKASLDDMKSEIIAAIAADKIVDKVEERKTKTFVSGIIGTAGYDAINVESNEALGVTIGARLDENFIIEGGFMYSNHYVDQVYYSYSSYFVYDDLDQYNFMTTAKYAPQWGRFSPQIGAIASYTYRKYTEMNYNYYYNSPTPYNYGYNYNQESETQAFDLGVSLGMEFEVSDSFIIGAEYRYFTNLTSKSDSRALNDYYNYYNVGTPLEEFDYYSFAVSGKVLF